LLILGATSGTLALVSMSLADFNIISGEATRGIAKTLLAIAAILVSFASRKMYNLMKNVPPTLIDKISK
jgi:hypothetical protein